MRTVYTLVLLALLLIQGIFSKRVEVADRHFLVPPGMKEQASARTRILPPVLIEAAR